MKEDDNKEAKPQKTQVPNQQDKVIRCPRCGSNQLTVGKHSIDSGFDITSALLTDYITNSSLAGFLMGSLNGNTGSELFIYCLACQTEFSPDELQPKSSNAKPESYPEIDSSCSCGCFTYLIISIILTTIFMLINFFTDKS